MKETSPWSAVAWHEVGPLYDRILESPFVAELSAGTLPEAKFAAYLSQDALYLCDYSRVLAHIASRLTDKSHIGAFARFACDGIAVEEAMHEGFLSRYGVRSVVKSPSCELYTSILKAHSYSPVEVELAAVLPCFKVYLEVGKNIAARSVADNPYAGWIATYADPGFEDSTIKALAIADELAARAGDDIRRAMTEAFVQCTKMEWLFWQSAYELE